jgi:DNA-binding MarR family transcriptional regulator
MKNAPNHLATPTYQLSLLQSKAYRVLSAFMADSLKRHNLSMPQWTVLGVVYDNDELRPFQIADMLGVRPPVATSVINELESKTLLVRKPHPSDNRATVVAVTRKGKSLAHKVEAQLYKELHGFTDDIAPSELVVYMRVLSRLAAKS